MKNIIILFLFLTSIMTNSCKDKTIESDDFQPSLDLEEYVLMKVNGVERIFTIEDDIRVSEMIRNDGDTSILISLNPSPNFEDFFSLEIKNPMLGKLTETQVGISYTSYSDEPANFVLSCSPLLGCDGRIELIIHELGAVDEKIVGEISGRISKNTDDFNDFSGEFVVYIDE